MATIMIKNVLITVVALSGLTVSATSQQRVEARSGRIATNAERVARTVADQRQNRREVVRTSRREVLRQGRRDVVRQGRRDVVRQGRRDVVRQGRRDRYRPAPRRVVRPAARVSYYPAARRQVWVPGYYEVVRVPPRYGWTIGWGGFRMWGLVEPACSQRVWRPGYWAASGSTRRVVRRRY